MDVGGSTISIGSYLLRCGTSNLVNFTTWYGWLGYGVPALSICSDLFRILTGWPSLTALFPRRTGTPVPASRRRKGTGRPPGTARRSGSVLHGRCSWKRPRGGVRWSSRGRGVAWGRAGIFACISHWMWVRCCSGLVASAAAPPGTWFP